MNRASLEKKAGNSRSHLQDIGHNRNITVPSGRSVVAGSLVIWFKWMRRCRGARRCSSIAATKSGHYLTPGLLALALAAIAVVFFTLWHVHSNRSKTPLSIPAPRDLALLDPQLKSYLQAKVAWAKEKPRDADRQATLGMAYAANGLWETAREAFRNVQRLEADQPLAFMYVAIANQELGDLKGAIELYRELTVRFPDFAPGYYRLGDASLRAGEVAQAEAAFKRLIDLAPKEWRGYAGLGDVKLRRGEYAAAAKDLEQAVQLAPAEKIARHLLGLAYRGLGRSEEAQIELNRGLNAQHYPMPDAWGANAAEHMKLLPDLYEMAKNYSGAGKPEKAVEILEEALAFHPGDLGVINKLALAYNDSGRPQKGRELLIKVVEIDNRNLPAHLGLASVCASLGEYEQALTYATRATELGPNSAQAYLAEANALLGLERDDDALAALSSASRCDPQNAEIQMTLGDVCLQNLDRPEEALKHFQAAVRLDPTLVSGYVRIGQLKIEEGEFSQARWAVQMIRKLAPTSPALSILEQRLSKLEQLEKNRE